MHSIFHLSNPAWVLSAEWRCKNCLEVETSFVRMRDRSINIIAGMQLDGLGQQRGLVYTSVFRGCHGVPWNELSNSANY